MKKIFKFQNGEVIKVGDKVVLSGVIGVVESIFLPNTRCAKDYGCFDSGGILISQPEGLGLVLIANPEHDEDLELLAIRGQTNPPPPSDPPLD